MLSYRHACHAGNFADVLKHQCACLLLSRLAAKDKPLTVIETHAGAGVYDLTAPLARRTREASSGIARALLDQRLQLYVPEYYEALRKLQFDAGAAAALSGARDARRAGSVSEDAPRPVSAVSAAVSPAVSPAVSAVNVNHVNHEDHVKHADAVNAGTAQDAPGVSLRDRDAAPQIQPEDDGELVTLPRYYPGSPWLLRQLLRPGDHQFLCELHPADALILQALFARDRQVTVARRDGLEALRALLPPRLRRGLCLLDPSYEERGEYQAVAHALREAVKRWPQGTYALWYPLLGRRSDYSRELTNAVLRLNTPLVQLQLQVRPQEQERGMCGCGMLIINCPYGLKEPLTRLVEGLRVCLGGAQSRAWCEELRAAP